MSSYHKLCSWSSAGILLGSLLSMSAVAQGPDIIRPTRSKRRTLPLHKRRPLLMTINGTSTSLRTSGLLASVGRLVR